MSHSKPVLPIGATKGIDMISNPLPPKVDTFGDKNTVPDVAVSAVNAGVETYFVLSHDISAQAEVIAFVLPKHDSTHRWSVIVCWRGDGLNREISRNRTEDTWCAEIEPPEVACICSDNSEAITNRKRTIIELVVPSPFRGK